MLSLASDDDITDVLHVTTIHFTIIWVVERSPKFSSTFSQLHAIEAAIEREEIAEGLGGTLLWWIIGRSNWYKIFVSAG